MSRTRAQRGAGPGGGIAGATGTPGGPEAAESPFGHSGGGGVVHLDLDVTASRTVGVSVSHADLRFELPAWRLL